MLLALLLAAASEEIRVQDSEGLQRAAAAAKPGTRILLQPGSYKGGIHISNLHGTAASPIQIAAADPENRPVIVGGGSAIQLSDVSYLQIRNLVIERPEHNGLNIDDGGSYETPSSNVVIRSIAVRQVPKGNNDAIKLSGLDDFIVENCSVDSWGGSAIDMVGCHRGKVTGSTFKNGGDSAIQCKGGSSDIQIARNRFENYGQRGVNIGGSTGLPYFRPVIEKMPPTARYEARNISVLGCVFIGGMAPVAFVGVDGATVSRNTIYRPGRWAMRILQETRTEGFLPCQKGIFQDNLVIFQRGSWASGGINIGPGTKPETFTFARNFWFCEDSPANSRPTLPTPEKEGIYGQDPQLDEALRPKPSSPATKVGAHSLN